jgi:hypothetical protein
LAALAVVQLIILPYETDVSNAVMEILHCSQMGTRLTDRT